jgi:hypothetical protein
MIYRRILAYGLALGLTLVALLLTLWLQAYIPRTLGAFFYIAIALSTWQGGIRPGLVAILLSAREQCKIVGLNGREMSG